MSDDSSGIIKSSAKTKRSMKQISGSRKDLSGIVLSYQALYPDGEISCWNDDKLMDSFNGSGSSQPQFIPYLQERDNLGHLLSLPKVFPFFSLKN